VLSEKNDKDLLKTIDKISFLWYDCATLETGFFDEKIFALPNASSVGGRKRRV